MLCCVKRSGRGSASPDVEYSQREIMNFLMMPGFSTNQEVTEFSGRGVGMDVVKKNVETVGGVVTMTSEKGKGELYDSQNPAHYRDYGRYGGAGWRIHLYHPDPEYKAVL